MLIVTPLSPCGPRGPVSPCGPVAPVSLGALRANFEIQIVFEILRVSVPHSAIAIQDSNLIRRALQIRYTIDGKSSSDMDIAIEK